MKFVPVVSGNKVTSYEVSLKLYTEATLEPIIDHGTYITDISTMIMTSSLQVNYILPVQEVVTHLI